MRPMPTTESPERQQLDRPALSEPAAIPRFTRQ